VMRTGSVGPGQVRDGLTTENTENTEGRQER
jgi:hypothetical protein